MTFSKRVNCSKGLMRALVASVFMLVSGCDSPEFKPSANYCKMENRQIPDAELKGRLLLSLFKGQIHGRRMPFITIEIEQHLASLGLSANALSSGLDPRVSRALAEFVEQQPLCCQLVVKELTSPTNEQLLDDETRDGYFANFYVLKPPYCVVPEDGLLGDYRIGNYRAYVEAWKKETDPCRNDNIASISRAYNCGFSMSLH